VDLVAVHDGLALFVRRHQRREAADGAAAVLDENVAEVGRLHFLALLDRVPTLGRGLIVSTARLVDQAEAGVEIRIGQVPGPREAELVRFARFRMLPFCLPFRVAGGATRKGLSVPNLPGLGTLGR